MPPTWGTDIIDFKVEPVKALYSPGESVVFSGRLRVHGLGGYYYPSGRPIEIWGDTTKTEFGGVTGPDGWFEIAVDLPLEPRPYTYRARFPGYDTWAWENPSWSRAITLSTEVPEVPTPPPPPPPPPPGIPKYILYASLGLLGVGALMWLVRR